MGSKQPQTPQHLTDDEWDKLKESFKWLGWTTQNCSSIQCLRELREMLESRLELEFEEYT